jgi:hypothetical protein
MTTTIDNTVVHKSPAKGESILGYKSFNHILANLEAAQHQQQQHHHQQHHHQQHQHQQHQHQHQQQQQQHNSKPTTPRPLPPLRNNNVPTTPTWRPKPVPVPTPVHPTTGELLVAINRVEASIHTLNMNVHEGFRVLSYNSIMAERTARRAWNQLHPLDLQEVILEESRERRRK